MMTSRVEEEKQKGQKNKRTEKRKRLSVRKKISTRRICCARILKNNSSADPRWPTLYNLRSKNALSLSLSFFLSFFLSLSLSLSIFGFSFQRT
jgi:hypothetical protein